MKTFVLHCAKHLHKAVPAALFIVICATSLAQAAEAPVRLSPNKWFRKPSGYDKALDLQQQTGKDMLVYFSNYILKDQKGLCKWFEKHALHSGELGKLIRQYIKVQINLPGGKKAQPLIEHFHVRKTPAVFVVQPNGHYKRIRVFNWPGGRPQLKKPEEIAALVLSASSPAN